MDLDDALARIAITADLDPLGELPEEIDHIATRGAHPELALDPKNLRGLSHRTHVQRHSQGLSLDDRPRTIEDLW